MPIMSGLEATLAIRAMEIEQDATTSIPHRTIIIALTANAMDSCRQACLETGLDGKSQKNCPPIDILCN